MKDDDKCVFQWLVNVRCFDQKNVRGFVDKLEHFGVLGDFVDILEDFK